MKDIKRILRLSFEQGLSNRQIAKSLGRSSGSVSGTVKRAKVIGLDWPKAQDMGEEALEIALYGPKKGADPDRPKPDCAWIHKELKKVGVTLLVLHLEYLQAHEDGYRYTQFCAHYKDWLKRRSPTLRQQHKAGEKMFVDYSGKLACITDPRTGQKTPVQIFVATLGASNYTYAEASYTQKTEDFLESHVRALEYFGGVPRLIVPDQLKTGVKTACKYEPAIQRAYQELAEHYRTAIVPARPYKPRDKAKVENAVLLVQRWILARLRHETFYSLGALNERIRELLEDFNTRAMRTYKLSRRALFEEIEQKELQPLPKDRFQVGTWTLQKVQSDYHVPFDDHHYSVSHTLLEETVEIRSTATTIEIYHRGDRVAAHRRSFQRGGHTTEEAHRPPQHRAYHQNNNEQLTVWAQRIGPSCLAFVEAVLQTKASAQQGYRASLGTLRLEKTYGAHRLEKACAYALLGQGLSYQHVKTLLKNGIDRLQQEDSEPTFTPVMHENVRGASYYEAHQRADTEEHILQSNLQDSKDSLH